jgi:hypothetical protein
MIQPLQPSMLPICHDGAAYFSSSARIHLFVTGYYQSKARFSLENWISFGVVIKQWGCHDAGQSYLVV